MTVRECRGFLRVFPVLLLLSNVTPVGAQAIRGLVLDADTGHPVDGVSVMLMDSDDGVAKGVLSNEVGSFLILAPRTGRYRVQLERIGYETTTSAAIDLLPPDTVEVQLRMSMEVVVLAPLTITSERNPLVMDTRLASWGYYDRKAHYGRLGSGVTHFREASVLHLGHWPGMGGQTGIDITGTCLNRKVAQSGAHRVRVQPGSRSEPGYLAHRPVEFILAQRRQTRDTTQGHLRHGRVVLKR